MNYNKLAQAAQLQIKIANKLKRTNTQNDIVQELKSAAKKLQVMILKEIEANHSSKEERIKIIINTFGANVAKQYIEKRFKNSGAKNKFLKMCKN